MIAFTHDMFIEAVGAFPVSVAMLEKLIEPVAGSVMIYPY